MLHAGALRDVVAQVAQAQAQVPARTFWCALQGFAELVAGGQLARSLYVKQLFGLIHLQMRRQSQGGSDLPEAMLRDALFFIAAHAPDLEPITKTEPGPEHASPILQQLSCGYRLAGMVPLDFEARHYERAWSALANGDGAAPPSNVIDFPLLPAAGAAQGEPMKQIGKLAISLATHRAYLSGTDLLLRLLTQDFGEWRHEPQRAASGAALLAARTLAETSGAIGFHSMRQLAQALEMALHGARARPAPAPVLSPAQRDLLERVLECNRLMLHHFALGDLPAGQGELLVALQQLCVQLQSASRPGALGPGSAPAAQERAEEAIQESSPEASPRVALVRVRADILGRIALQAGAVSGARVSLEQDVIALRAMLSDFSTSLGRLRRHLRDVEMQAEAQIASRMAIADAGQFDPLEFDRCARLQELTRIMAESVSDVASVHQNLMRGVEIGRGHLQQQAGLTRALQSDLALVHRADRPLRAARVVRSVKGALAPRTTVRPFPRP
jgi:HPt (histidine-containing phosphotransfer) domain-containing protein